MISETWIATGIAIPCVGCLISLVISSNKRQDSITRTFMTHVEQQTTTLVVMKDQLVSLCSNSVSKVDIERDLADQAHYIKDIVTTLESKISADHMAIVKTLNEVRGVLQSMLKQLKLTSKPVTKEDIECIIIDTLKSGIATAQVSSLDSDNIVANIVVAKKIRATEIIGGNVNELGTT
jgi:ribosome-binding factor A